MWGLKATPFPQLSLSSHLASSHSALGNPFSVCVGGGAVGREGLDVLYNGCLLLLTGCPGQ